MPGTLTALSRTKYHDLTQGHTTHVPRIKNLPTLEGSKSLPFLSTTTFEMGLTTYLVSTVGHEWHLSYHVPRSTENSSLQYLRAPGESVHQPGVGAPERGHDPLKRLLCLHLERNISYTKLLDISGFEMVKYSDESHSAGHHGLSAGCSISGDSGGHQHLAPLITDTH